jgi:hypothetical protein
VQSFTVERDSTSIGSVSSSTFTLLDDPNFDFFASIYEGPSYRVVADFGGGNTSTSLWATVVKPELTPDAHIVRGPQGRLYLVMANPPPDIETIRFWWYGTGYPTFEIGVSNMVNGIIELPTAELEPFANYSWFYSLWAQIRYADGQVSKILSVRPQVGDRQYIYEGINSGIRYPSHFNFPDARYHMKENLVFLLRAATVSQPFN